MGQEIELDSLNIDSREASLGDISISIEIVSLGFMDRVKIRYLSECFRLGSVNSFNFFPQIHFG